jgi:hypothetical protein
MRNPMSIGARLPPNFMMQTTGLKDVAVSMSFTLTTLDHVAALKEALDKAVIPILEMREPAEEPTDTGSVT